MNVTDADVMRISKCKLFCDVPVDELRTILPVADLKISTFAKGTLIHTRGEPCDDLLILLTGRVSGEFQDYNGRVLLVETMAAPETIASAFLFAPEPTFPVNIVAIDDVRITSVHREVVVHVARSSQAVMKSLLEDIAGRTAFLAEKLRLTQFATLRQKIAGYLLERSGSEESTRIAFPVTQQTIAELFGVARPSLGRVLHELEEAGIIVRDRRTILIRDRQALQDLLVDVE